MRSSLAIRCQLGKEFGSTVGDADAPCRINLEFTLLAAGVEDKAANSHINIVAVQINTDVLALGSMTTQL